MTGGISDGTKPIKSSHVFDLEENTFHDIADLNIKRYLHSSTTMGKHVYVFCGKESSSTHIKTIESYDISQPSSSANWTQIILSKEMLTPRELPILGVLSDSEILIAGGRGVAHNLPSLSEKVTTLCDVLVFNTREQTIRSVSNAPA